MASRGGTGAIVVAAVAGVLALAFFVAWLFVLGQLNEARTAQADAEASLTAFISSGERDIAARFEQAAEQQRTSVFNIMNGRLSDMTEIVAGTDGSTPEEVRAQISDLSGPNGNPVIQRLTRGNDEPLLTLVRSLANEVADLETELEQANAERRAAIRGLNEQSEFVASERTRFNTEQGQLQGLVDRYVGDVETQLQNLESESRGMRERIDDARAQADAEKAELQAEVSELSSQILALQDQLRAARGLGTGGSLAGADEAALVDAEVVAINATDGSIVLNRGKRDRMVLGLRFVIYDDATSIRPNAAGNYPPGKATVEVINVGETSATARILSETQGNPIVRGDAMANAIYDPKKTYKFVVDGLFDTNRDGRFTRLERDNVAAQIAQWGGVVVDELEGDVDFVVLGQRPVLPPRPSSSAPIEIQQQYLELLRVVDGYNAMQESAESTRIPILNLNRLTTLTGGL